jgi:hypothetical protein
VGSAVVGQAAQWWRLPVWYGVLLLAVLAFGPFSNYSPVGYLDPWIYTGYFLSFDELVQRYGYSYYGSRLGYILPGVALYKILPPVVANFAYKLLIFVLAVVSLHRILRPFCSAALAVAICACFTMNAYVAQSMTWDYPNGLPLALILGGFSLGLVPLAAFPRQYSFFLAGVCWALAGAIHATSGLVIAPGVVALLMVPNAQSPRQKIADMLSLTAGVLAALAALAVATRVVYGTANILGPQLDQYRYARDRPGYLPAMYPALAGWDWLVHQHRLWIFLAAMIGGLVAVFRKPHRGSEATQLEVVTLWLLLSLAAYAVADFVGQKYQLRVYYTSAFLLAPAFVVVGYCVAVTEPKSRGWSESWQTILSWIVFVPACLTAPLGAWLAQATDIGITGRWALLAALSAPILFLILRRRSAHTWPWQAGALLLAVNASVIMQSETRAVQNDRHNAFNAAVQMSRLVREKAPWDSGLRFWYDASEEQAPLYHSLYSLRLWRYIDLSKELAKGSSKLASLLVPGTHVVLLSSTPETIHARISKLRERRFVLRMVHEEYISAGTYGFFVAVTRIESVPAYLQNKPQGISFTNPLFAANASLLTRIYEVNPYTKKQPRPRIVTVGRGLVFHPVDIGDHIALPFLSPSAQGPEKGWLKIDINIPEGFFASACRIIVQDDQIEEIAGFQCPEPSNSPTTYYVQLPATKARFRLAIIPTKVAAVAVPSSITIFGEDR